MVEVVGPMWVDFFYLPCQLEYSRHFLRASIDLRVSFPENVSERDLIKSCFQLGNLLQNGCKVDVVTMLGLVYAVYYIHRISKNLYIMDPFFMCKDKEHVQCQQIHSIVCPSSQSPFYVKKMVFIQVQYYPSTVDCRLTLGCPIKVSLWDCFINKFLSNISCPWRLLHQCKVVFNGQDVGCNQLGSSSLVFEDDLISMNPYTPVDYVRKSFERQHVSVVCPVRKCLFKVFPDPIKVLAIHPYQFQPYVLCEIACNEEVANGLRFFFTQAAPSQFMVIPLLQNIPGCSFVF